MAAFEICSYEKKQSWSQLVWLHNRFYCKKRFTFYKYSIYYLETKCPQARKSNRSRVLILLPWLKTLCDSLDYCLVNILNVLATHYLIITYILKKYSHF